MRIAQQEDCMKLILVFATISLLSTGINVHAQSPAEILTSAVSKMRPCEYDAKKAKLDKAGNLISWMVTDKDEKRDSQKLSLPMLFRENRYDLRVIDARLSYEPPIEDPLVIKFAPLPEEKQIKARVGESKIYNRAMNNLDGHVIIDPATHEIAQVRAWLTTPLDYFVYNLERLSLEITNDQHGESWKPSKVELKIFGERKFLFSLGRVDRLYETTFSC